MPGRPHRKVGLFFARFSLKTAARAAFPSGKYLNSALTGLRGFPIFCPFPTQRRGLARAINRYRGLDMQPHDNWLLLSLPEKDLLRLKPGLQRVRLEKGRPL